MNENTFNLVKKEIEEILPKSLLKFEPTHSKLTLEWLLKLKPNADEAMQVSALAHDIDRAITGITEKDLKDYSKIDEFKKEHAIRSAKFTTEILRKHECDEEDIKRVQHLIENHEEGGDEDQTTLMEADSLAYFDYNIPKYLGRNGEERTKQKIKFMYERLSDESKKLVRQIEFDDEKIKKLLEESIS